MQIAFSPPSSSEREHGKRRNTIQLAARTCSDDEVMDCAEDTIDASNDFRSGRAILS